jgi:protein-S-isoprenylcysteine O-methyltransferase Ste14
MIAWINFSICILSSILFLYFYVRSVSPAGQELVEGPAVYKKCYYLRLISGFFELVITINYVLFLFFPLPSLPLAERFPWAWWISIIIGLIIGIPATWLMIKGAQDAGEETLMPKKEHKMYSGIYQKMRHPQAVGEVFLFGVIALLLNSPFLTLFSVIFFPIFIIMCYAEEQDLLLRYGQDYVEYCKRTGAFWPKSS